MSIALSILGEGPVAELLVKRVQQNAGLQLIEQIASSATPSKESTCAVHLPSAEELSSGNAAKQITQLLKAGFNVVSTVPVSALDKNSVMAACAEGGTTFHGSGGFQSSLAYRFNRAFSAITRNIRSVELVEELDVTEGGVYPLPSPFSLDMKTEQVEPFYDAGMHTLSEAVLGQSQGDIGFESMSISGGESQPVPRNKTPEEDRVIVRRTLGTQLAYDSVWTQPVADRAPLRYQLCTTSSDAAGNVSIHFHGDGYVHPANHLTCNSLLDAISAASNSKPGILHNDLEINYVKPDDRLT